MRCAGRPHNMEFPPKLTNSTDCVKLANGIYTMVPTAWPRFHSPEWNEIRYRVKVLQHNSQSLSDLEEKRKFEGRFKKGKAKAHRNQINDFYIQARILYDDILLELLKS